MRTATMDEHAHAWFRRYWTFGAGAGAAVLLIASNAMGERAIDQIYRDRIGRNASLWYLPDAGHNGGLSTHPAQYAPRIESFLASALRVQQPESPNLGAPSRRLMLLAAR